MRWLFVVAIVLPLHLEAADFRLSDFGDSCALLSEREAALGGAPVPWKGDGPNKQGYKGSWLGRDVHILYLCKSGKLVIGNYLLPWQPREPAVETLHAVYDHLVATYGVPWLDSSPWQYGQTIVDPRATVEPGYMTTWKTTRVNVTVGLVPEKDEAGPNWQVLVVFQSPELTKRAPKRPGAGGTDP